MKKYSKYGIPIFFGIVLLFTLLSTTVGEYLLPLVQVCELKGGALEKTYRAEGILGLDVDKIKANKQDVLSPIDGKISDLKVKEQQEVKKGDLLCIMTSKNEEERVDKEHIKSENESLKIKEKRLKQEENYLKEQLEAVKKEQEESNNLPIIQQERVLAQKEKEVVQKENLFKIGAISQNEYTQIQEELQVAKEKLESLTKEQSQAYKDKINPLEFKISQLMNEEEDIKQQISFKEKELKMKETKQEVVLAPMSGFIQELEITPGRSVEENMQMMTLVPKEIPYVLAFDVPIAQNQLIAIEDQVSFKIGHFKREGTVIRKKLDKECENYRITCTVDLKSLESLGINLKEYQKVEVLASNCTESYEYVVPTTAIVTKEGKEVIYSVEETRTLLGKKQTVKEIPIDIIDDNNEQAAIEGNLSLGTRIITQMSKSLKNGDKVRMD